MRSITRAFLVGLVGALGAGVTAAAADEAAPRTGGAAFGDWRSDAPGVRRLITPADLPAPYATRFAANPPRLVARPADAAPKAPEGFAVNVFASGLAGPRALRVAPNGDVFVAESEAGRVRVLRSASDGSVATVNEVFAAGLDGVYGLAFYPPGPEPRFLYVGTTRAVARFAYHVGDLQASGAPQIVVPRLPGGGHWTRDVAFSPDGTTLFVAVGSATNAAEGMPPLAEAMTRAEAAKLPLGSAWGYEEDRADVLAFDPEGRAKRVFATGLRNCAGLATRPSDGALWCVVNERDGLGDDLPPDYATQVREGAFYGWPWFYIGPHEDPRHPNERAELAARITTPDVLFQPHSAPLGIAFYAAPQFPLAYRGDGFVTLHGSWNRAKRTGYKVVRLPMKDGAPTGTYEDFLTGFVADDAHVYGRPVGVAVAGDGSLLVSDDGAGMVWRVSAAKR